MPEIDTTYFRRGFGLTREIEPIVQAEYHSQLVELIRERGNSFEVGTPDRSITIRLANSFGFCYGVDRAIDYAYQTRAHFPDRKLYLVGEIIHNPHVNARMRELGIEFLYPSAEGRFDFSAVQPDDVVILPAFGVTVSDFNALRLIGCSVVDTTCGSVLNVWKRVEQYARDGYTSLIHGKYHHEETKATASQVFKHPDGRFIIVLDMDEARLVMDYIEGAPQALSRESFLEYFARRSSPGFDPDLHLTRIGCANQTTMLAGESLAIAAEVGSSLERRFGGDPDFDLAWHFRSFDTICSATQERQDAILEMMEGENGPPEIMVVIGGYNSSNTNHLAVMCSRYATTYHIADADRIDPVHGTIRFKPAGTSLTSPEVEAEDWLPIGSLTIGITAGASTPNNKIGETVEAIFATLGVSANPQAANGSQPS